MGDIYNTAGVGMPPHDPAQDGKTFGSHPTEGQKRRPCPRCPRRVAWDLRATTAAQLIGWMDTEGRAPNRTTARSYVGEAGFPGKE